MPDGNPRRGSGHPRAWFLGGSLSLRRLALLAVAAVLPLGVLFVEQALRKDFVAVPYVAGISALIFLMVIARLHRMSSELLTLAHREQVLEDKYRSLVETTGNWIWESDETGRFTYSNEAVFGILGLTPEELVGRDALSLIHEADREAFQGRRNRSVSAGVGWTAAVNRWRHRDGSYRHLESNASPIFGRHGEVLGFRGTDRDLTERRRLEDQIAHQAMYDSLTDLVNRALFRDRLGHAMAATTRHGRPVVVLMMDINGFKGINDTCGHAAGDQLLVEVGRRIEECVRPSDTVARLGGDEFAVLAQDADVPQAVVVAERIVSRLRPPFFLDGREMYVDLSIGIAEAGPDCTDSDQLLRNADAAMFAAKREGKGRFEIYEPQFHAAVLERLALGTALRRAVEHQEFVLHFQPVVQLEDARMVGVEALVRWEQEGKGLVSPAAFIPVAEQTGLIVDIDRWVLNEACRQTATWQERFPRDPATGVSVNVSARQLHDGGLVREVAGALAKNHLDPRSLTLEITESVVMKNIEATISVMSDLKALGVKLAIDDFGIGFSSLSYLRQLPVDVVKIDRSFVSGVASGSHEWTLARGIVKLVHGLGLETIAEGVERAEQVAHLRALGCRLAQGYYFAKPMPALQLAERLQEVGSRPA